MDSPAGVLWGVGVGPGDPDLLTLKAARVLSETRLIAYFAKRGRPGNARTIAEPHLRPDRQELRLEFPVTVEVPACDPDYRRQMDAFYDAGAAQVAGHLERGQAVAVLCEGDPFFYGSYMYLHDRLGHRFDARVVPGVTGMSGCWTAADAPITRGDHVMTVLPGTLPADALASRLHTTDAAVIMKVGRNLPKIRAALDAAGLLARAVYVERGTMDQQRVQPLADRDPALVAPYFSMVLVPGGGRGR